VTSQIETDYIYFGFGKITNNLIDQARSKGKSVVCVTNQNHGTCLEKNTTFIDLEGLRELKVKSKTAIFSWKEINTLNTASLEWVASNSFFTKNSFLLSSTSLYKNSDLPIDEVDSNLEDNFAENKKYILERILAKTLREKSIRHTNLRLSNVFGKNLEYGFIANLLHSLRSQKPAVIFNETNITRDYLSIDDLGIAVAKLSDLDVSEENLNVGNGTGITISGVLEVFSNLGFDFANSDYVSAPANIRQKVVLDCTKLKSIIDWCPKDFETDIKKVLKSLNIPT
jgi:nucleoside-diphosphate-sugar epimerase